MIEPDWRAFERAIAAFCKALDPDARVSHDVSTPDADTGTPRQRDVWIEALICRQFPVRVLVSCKRYRRKLNQQDIDAFLGELRSSGANVGVIYSHSGFSANALAKGQAAGVSCCRFYNNEPPDLPEVLFMTSYCWRPWIRVRIPTIPPDLATAVWSDIFPLQDDEGTLLDQLDRAVSSSAGRAAASVSAGDLRPDQVSSVVISVESSEGSAFEVVVQHRWSLYRGKLEAHIASGSYSETNGSFVGSISGPAVEMQSQHPGPGWDLIPPNQDLEVGAVHAITRLGSLRGALVSELAGKPLREVEEHED